MDMAGEGLITYYTGGELLRQKEIGGLSPSWQAIVASPDFTYQAVYLADGTSRRTLNALIETLGARFDRERFHKVSETPRVYSSRLQRPSIRILSVRISWASRKRPCSLCRMSFLPPRKMVLWWPFAPITS